MNFGNNEFSQSTQFINTKSTKSNAIDSALGLINKVAPALENIQSNAVENFKQRATKFNQDWSYITDINTRAKKGEKITKQENDKYNEILKEQSSIVIGLTGNLGMGQEGIKTIGQIALQKLTDAIKTAKPARIATEAMYTAERGAKALKASKVLENIPGQKGFFAALGKMKGELPKATIEAPKMAQEEIDSLYQTIKTYPNLDVFGKLNVGNGLTKILSGELPANSELKLMQSVFGEDLIKTVLSKRTLGTKIGENLLEAINIPRAMMSSMDASAFLRQGLVATTYKPKLAIPAGVDMLKYFANPKTFTEAMEEITTRKTYPLMQWSGLHLTDITGKAVGLSNKEEAFMSNFAAKIPIFGKLVKASERAYTGFLNKIRADIFDDVSNQFIKGGYTPDNTPEVFVNLADFLNNITGRGKIPEIAGIGGERWAQGLNGLFFSPRFMMSRVNLLNPTYYGKLSVPVRKEAAKAMVQLVGVGLSVLSMAKLSGAEVEIDPRNSDFGKIKIGTRRWDIWGGFQQWVRFTTQLMMGQSKSSTTGKVSDVNRKDKLYQFFEGKTTPIISLGLDLLRGKTLVGESLNINNAVVNRLVPMYMQDIVDATKEAGIMGGISVGVPGFFGISTQAYAPHKTKTTTKSSDNRIDKALGF